MKKSILPVFLKILFAMLLLIFSQTVAGIVVTLIHMGSVLSEIQTGDLATLDGRLLELLMQYQTEMLLISYAIVILALMIAARQKKQRMIAYVGLDRKASASLVVLALLAGVAAAIWSTIAIGLVPWPEQWMEIYETESSSLRTSMPVLDVLSVVCIGPVIEELLFRGLIYDALCAILPAGLAVLFQGILFGSVHGTAIWMIYAGLVGCLIGYVRKRTGSLWPGIAMHIAYNGSSYPISWLAVWLEEDRAAVVGSFIGSALLLILFIYGIHSRTLPQELPKE